MNRYDLIWLKRMRNWAGLLGGLLPLISLAGAWIYASAQGVPDGFWYGLSVSETYYVTPALAGILTAASLVLVCYKGYVWEDNLVTTLSGVFGLLIVLFPCSCAASPARAGFFQLPVGASNIVHSVSAVTFFLLLAYNDVFLFTRTNKKEPGRMKKIRNTIYYVCGAGMALGAVLLIIPVDFPAKIWWAELVMLLFFSFSWLVKGDAFPFLNDRSSHD